MNIVHGASQHRTRYLRIFKLQVRTDPHIAQVLHPHSHSPISPSLFYKRGCGACTRGDTRRPEMRTDRELRPHFSDNMKGQAPRLAPSSRQSNSYAPTLPAAPEYRQSYGRVYLAMQPPLAPYRSRRHPGSPDASSAPSVLGTASGQDNWSARRWH